MDRQIAHNNADDILHTIIPVVLHISMRQGGSRDIKTNIDRTGTYEKYMPVTVGNRWL